MISKNYYLNAVETQIKSKLPKSAAGNYKNVGTDTGEIQATANKTQRGWQAFKFMLRLFAYRMYTGVLRSFCWVIEGDCDVVGTTMICGVDLQVLWEKYLAILLL